MRLLGIDYGSKRVGVSVSDESRKYALPVSVISNSPLLIDEIEKIAKDQGVKEIVLGESRKFDMTPNKILAEIETFKKQLQDRGYTVRMELEFMTSMQARRFQGKNELTDASAAALILQSYLDRDIKEQQ